MNSRDVDMGPGARRPLVGAGLRVALCGCLILLTQCLFWLGQGYWTVFNLREILLASGMRLPVVPWHGAQSIIDWTQAFPLGGTAILVGVALVLIGARSPPATGESARAR